MSEQVGVKFVTEADLKGIDAVNKAVADLMSNLRGLSGVPGAAPAGGGSAPGVRPSVPPVPPVVGPSGLAPGVSPSAPWPPYHNPGLWPPGQYPPGYGPPPLPPPPPAAPPAPPAPPPPPSSGSASSGGWRGGNGDYGPMDGRQRTSSSLWDRLQTSTVGRAVGQARDAASWLGDKATQGFTFGMGESPMGFLMSSATTYMELSKVLTQVGQRFREAEGNAASFGQRLGYTLGETAAYANTLGEQTNAVDRVTTQRYLGFARATGMDPGAAMSSLGQMQRLTGRGVNGDDLRAIVARAGALNMSQGRLGEFMGGTTSLLEQQLNRTGSADMTSALYLQQLPASVLGVDNPLAKGQAGIDLIDRLSSVVGGDANSAMKTYMMRAMGFGSAGGPSYIEMRKRLEAGIHGPEGLQNLRDLFGSFQKQGMGEGTMFRALESASGGQLKAREIEALVKAYGSPGGVARIGEGFEKDSALDEASSRLGWAGLGASKVSMGEGAAVQMEGMKMEVGQYTARGVLDMRDTVVALSQAGANLFGANAGEMLVGATGAVKQTAEDLREMTKGVTTIINLLTSIRDAVSNPNRAFREAVGLNPGGYEPSMEGMSALGADLGLAGGR